MTHDSPPPQTPPYAHNITDAMDNTVITHFMQLNAEWSFFGSLVIFRQELVILTDLKYPCLYIVYIQYIYRI